MTSEVGAGIESKVGQSMQKYSLFIISESFGELTKCQMLEIKTIFFREFINVNALIPLGLNTSANIFREFTKCHEGCHPLGPRPPSGSPMSPGLGGAGMVIKLIRSVVTLCWLFSMFCPPYKCLLNTYYNAGLGRRPADPSSKPGSKFHDD